jgi:hypothetical protein
MKRYKSAKRKGKRLVVVVQTPSYSEQKWMMPFAKCLVRSMKQVKGR